MKKMFALVMAVLMVAAMFAACGNASADRGDAIVIGLTGPFTGDNAVYGNAVKWGMEIAVEEINAKGGLQIVFEAQDDVSDNEKAGNAYNLLKDKGLQIFAGAVTTGPCNTIAPMAVNDQIFMMTPSGSAESIPMAGANVFQMCFTDPNQGASAAEVVNKYYPNAQIGVIYDSSDNYSIGLKDGFADKAAALGLNVVVTTSFSASTKADLSTQVEQCKSAGCDLVFMPFYYEQASQILKYANSVGYAPNFLGCDGMDGILAQDGFDASIAEGLMLMTPFSASNTDAATVDFVAKYKAMMNGTEPNQFAADGYDVIYAIYNACVATGVDGNTSASDACDTVAAYFTSNTFDGLTGTGLTGAADGTVSKTPAAVKIVNGAYVAMD